MALKLKIAIVGLGSIGKRHLRLLLERIDISLEICDPNQELINQIAKEYPELTVHCDFQSVIDSKPDIVWLCTPTHLHKEQSIASLRAGCHVFCEKPMAVNFDEAKKIKEVAKISGKIFFVGFYLRFWKGITVLKGLITENKLGNILHAHARVGTFITLENSTSRYQSFNPGSLFLDYSHQPDLMNWLFNSTPAKIFVSGFQGGDLPYLSDPNVADIHLAYAGKMQFNATIHLNYVQMPDRHEYEVVGDRGWAKLDGIAQTITVGMRSTATSETISVKQDRDDIFRQEHDFFLTLVLKGLPANDLIQSFVATQRICDGIIKSWKTKEIITV